MIRLWKVRRNEHSPYESDRVLHLRAGQIEKSQFSFKWRLQARNEIHP